MLPEKTIKDERPSLSTVPTAWGISFQAFFLYRHKSTFKKANEIDTIPFLPSLPTFAGHISLPGVYKSPVLLSGIFFSLVVKGQDMLSKDLSTPRSRGP